MQILLNSNNEIISYAVIGGFENGIKVDNIPDDFINNFKPLKYKYENKGISLNNNYLEEVDTPVQPPIVNTPNNDEELRKMFATMQVQLVQSNMMVKQLSEQNARLSQEVVVIKQKLEEVTNNEDVIPEV